ncbi:MAG: phosphoglyceromutase, partial [Sulfurimonas sp.]
MVKLILLRHGQSLYNKENLFTGWTDIDLSQQGRDEAKAAGALLKKHHLFPNICFTSWLKRSIHTAQIVLYEMAWEHIDCLRSWKLNERHYGAWQQHNKDHI